MQGLEVQAAAEWIYGKLSGDSTLASLLVGDDSAVGEIYQDTLPPDIFFPYIIISHIANADTMVTEGIRVLAQITCLVKCVDRAESYEERLKPLYSRIDQLLHKSGGGSVTDGYVFQVQRLSTVQYPEVREGTSYRHLGGRYKLWIQGQ